MRSRWAALLLATLALGTSPELRAAPPKAPSRTASKGSSPKKGQPKVAAKSASSSARPSAPRQPKEAVRRAIAGGPVQGEAKKDVESPELRLLREMDRELFPAFSPYPSEPIELPAPLSDPRHPLVHASGLPPPPPLVEPRVAEGERDLSWLRELQMPDLPARWDARVIRYLEYYRDNPRGRNVAALSIRRSGRWASAMRSALRAEGIPEDLVWASMIESAFNPTARSHAGAAGLWQFMPGTARIYGLVVDSNIDERLDPERATLAAARHLSDLYRRFGSWELALAAYNMGYGGLLSAIRKFNTNDYWELGRWESGIPWETTLYVPKIIAMTIVARNPAVFGLEGIELDPPVEADPVPIPGGITLKAIAATAGVPESELVALNPQLRAGKTPPKGEGEASTWIVRVPLGLGPKVAKRYTPNLSEAETIERHVVRFGESLDSIAETRGIPKARLAELNRLREGEPLRTKDVLLIPAGEPPRAANAKGTEEEEGELPVVVVPPTPFEIEGHRRVFYRVLSSDGLLEIAEAFGVLADDLRRWNALDPKARLHPGMSLQLFVPEEVSLSHVLCLEEAEVRVLSIGSEEFFAFFEGLRGRKRARITVEAGDTWQKLGQKYGLSLGQLERINRRSRRSALTEGETVVVYAPLDQTIPSSRLVLDEEEAKAESEPLPSLEAPKPSDLSEAPEAEEPALARGEGE